MALDWLKNLFGTSPSSDGMPSTVMAPSTSKTSLASPVSKGRRDSFSPVSPRSVPSKASRKSSKSVRRDPKHVEEQSQEADEDSELMDDLTQESEGEFSAAEDEEPCTSSSNNHTPGRKRRRDARDFGREMSIESNDSDASLLTSPRKRLYYHINDVRNNRPAERFRTDILQRIRAPDSEYLPLSDDPSVLPSCLRLTDRWREEWSHGVQVPLHPDDLPHFETQPCDIPSYASMPFRLPKGKYLLSRPAPYATDEGHLLIEPPYLRIYQGDRLDEIWLEKLNSQHLLDGLPQMELSLMLTLMNEYEIECFTNMHRIVLATLASSDTLDSNSMVDEDAPCDVCKLSDADDDDVMVFCDGCNICLHQSCYGLKEVPEGNWECDMCVHVGFTRHDRLKCALCPNTGGAMKEVQSTGQWVHVSCAMWISELKVSELKDGTEVYLDLSSIFDWRYQLKCSICDLRSGACVQCAAKGCATPVHVTCAQRSGYCDVLGEKAETGDSIDFHVYCKKHTQQRKREREGGVGTVDQSDDESDERSELLRSLERAFYLHVKFERIAKRLECSHLHASDVYEYWKQKRGENGDRPLIACPEVEIDVQQDPVALESTVVGADGQILLSASLEIQRSLTPFQLKIWRFQKWVFQVADRGRLALDMIIKRERRKRDIVETGHKVFSHLVALDRASEGVPLSTRTISQMIEELERKMTPDEIAESERLAAELTGETSAASAAPVVAAAAAATKQTTKQRAPAAAAAAAPAAQQATRQRARVASTKENGVVAADAAPAAAAAKPPSPVKQRRSGRTSIGLPAATAAAALKASPPTRAASAAMSGKRVIATANRRLRPQNPPDGTKSASVSPSKLLRDRKEVKYC